MNTKMIARSFSVMNEGGSSALVYRKSGGEMPCLERSVLRESVAGQPRALRALGHFDAHGRCIWRSDTRRPQHGILTEHFVVNLGDQIVLAISVAAPDLPELDRTYCHGIL